MDALSKLIERIVARVNINLREPAFDVGPYVRGLVPLEQFSRFQAFYGITQHHPIEFKFEGSALAGSYFLGKCEVNNAVVYKSDIRGDELKSAGETYRYGDWDIALNEDERITVRDSLLVKTLVHNFSHDPEIPEAFFIRNSVALHYANIHGSPIEGVFLGPFATVDLTTVHNCVIGEFAYVQVDELNHELVLPGEIWIRSGKNFDFTFHYEDDQLRPYLSMQKGENPSGIFMDFVEERKPDFDEVFNTVRQEPPIPVPPGAALSRYTVVKGDTRISENVLVAQRAFLEDAHLGPGANAQENCYIIGSTLERMNVTAHGANIVYAKVGEKTFVGFNSFVRGKKESPIVFGKECIVMPHTIMDADEQITVPDRHIVWGYIRKTEDLKTNSVSMEDMRKVNGEFSRGTMRFSGSGEAFVEGFLHRIHHILEANGAFSDGITNAGHAQKGRHISYNTLEPYQEGERKGLCPTIHITP